MLESSGCTDDGLRGLDDDGGLRGLDGATARWCAWLERDAGHLTNEGIDVEVPVGSMGAAGIVNVVGGDGETVRREVLEGRYFGVCRRGSEVAEEGTARTGEGRTDDVEVIASFQDQDDRGVQFRREGLGHPEVALRRDQTLTEGVAPGSVEARTHKD